MTPVLVLAPGVSGEDLHGVTQRIRWLNSHSRGIAKSARQRGVDDGRRIERKLLKQREKYAAMSAEERTVMNREKRLSAKYRRDAMRIGAGRP